MNFMNICVSQAEHPWDIDSHVRIQCSVHYVSKRLFEQLISFGHRKN